MNGYVSDYINSIKQEIIDISSEIELQNDFSEEQFIDEDDKSEYKIIDKIDNIILQLKDILKNFHQGEIIKKGLPIAIVGKPNVGKSSLLNILCNEDRAIVSPIAGTTRDTIDIEVNIGDIVCRFIDTAGLRDDYKDEIEKIGIERSKKTIEKAQLVIFVVDVTMKEKDYIEDLNFIKKFNNDIVIVVNKIDLDEKYKTNFDNTIYVSAKKNINISKIKEYIKSKYKIREDEVVVNSRHFIVLNNILNILLKLKVDCQKNIPSEILMINIKEIIELLNTITGKTTSENILNNIFSNFCIGK
jgi:tRNA modification GTPase